MSDAEQPDAAAMNDAAEPSWMAEESSAPPASLAPPQPPPLPSAARRCGPCTHCGHVWTARLTTVPFPPKACARCRSLRWDIPLRDGESPSTAWQASNTRRRSHTLVARDSYRRKRLRVLTEQLGRDAALRVLKATVEDLAHVVADHPGGYAPAEVTMPDLPRSLPLVPLRSGMPPPPGTTATAMPPPPSATAAAASAAVPPDDSASRRAELMRLLEERRR